MDERIEERKLRLLIVEDDARTLEELTRILSRRTELEVIAAATPSQALLAPPADLALIDVRLPGMSGLDLLPRLREQNPDLLATVMTGFGEASTAREAREHGAVDFLEKPLDLPYLLVVLRQQEREAKLRRSLRAGAELMRTVVEGIPDGLLMTNTSGDPLWGNELGSALWGIGGHKPEETVTYQGRVYRTERSASLDRVLWRWVDLTKALEEERLKSYRSMARLLAHEIHNPLTPMRLWLQELGAASLAEPGGEKLAQEAVAILLDQVERLSKLAGRFKDLAEDRPFRMEEVPLERTVSAVYLALKPVAEKAGVTVHIKVPPEIRAVVDEGALYQVLFNLLSNAIEAQQGKEGQVFVQCSAAESSAAEVILAIEDQGGGLPPEVAAAPFTPYLTTKEGGTGLGLLVCRDLAQRMGGRLLIEDKPGIGLKAGVALRTNV
ncbi:MAG: response regulator [Acidobacteria bacterium]|nr:response regulator [Acidobacteriota bacterium]